MIKAEKIRDTNQFTRSFTYNNLLLPGFQRLPLTIKRQIVFVHTINVAYCAHSHLLHGDAFDLEEPLIGVQPPPPGLGAHALDPLRPHVVGGQDEGHPLALVALGRSDENTSELQSLMRIS